MCGTRKPCFDKLSELKFDGGSYFFELPLNARVEALILMFPIARSLNMILYVDEPNYGYIFCPDGQILGGSSTTPWQDVVKNVDFSLYPFARNATEFKKIAQHAFAELAAFHGFTKKKMPYMDNMGYMRAFEGISQHIGVQYERSYERIDAVVYVPSVYIYIKQVEFIAEKFGFEDSNKISLSFSSTGGVGAFSRVVRKWDIASLDDMQSALAKLDQLIFTEICDHAISIKSLDQLINRDFESLLYREIYDLGNDLASSLILARLAGNPNFEKLVEHAEAKDWWGGSKKIV